MRTAETEAFWRAYRRHEGLEHDHYQPTYLRTDPAVGERLTAMVSAGAKRAVVAPLRYFGEGGEEPLPAAGDHALLLDHRRRPRLIWRTTGVAVAPLASVTEEFIWRDGDGGGSREEWLALARSLLGEQARLQGFEMHDGVEAVFETFELVWPPAAARRARLLAPRLEQGLALLRRLEEARAVARDLAAVLARVGTAVMTLGPGLRLRSANPAAEALLRRGDGLRLREGQLRARDPRDERAVAAAVAAASRRTTSGAVEGRGGPGDALLAVGRGDDRPPYRLGVFALPGDDAAPTGRHADPSVLLLVGDPERDAAPARSEEDLLARAFGLTPAEARLAARLAAGASLTEAADALGVTRNTARAQLRAVFDKAEVRRQGELVRLLHGARSLRLSPR
jgi:uncharacterized protein YhfF/DNA-binding CsgD family transcriptional regulator